MYGRDAVPVARTPPLDFAADVVDQRVLLPPLAREIEVEGLLLVLSRPCGSTGTGMKDSLGRRPGRSCPVGPFGPISKCDSGRVVRRVENRISEVRLSHRDGRYRDHRRLDNTGARSDVEPGSRRTVGLRRGAVRARSGFSAHAFPAACLIGRQQAPFSACRTPRVEGPACSLLPHTRQDEAVERSRRPSDQSLDPAHRHLRRLVEERNDPDGRPGQGPLDAVEVSGESITYTARG